MSSKNIPDSSPYLDFYPVSPEYTEEISIIPRNIVTECRKRIENLSPNSDNVNKYIADNLLQILTEQATGVEKRHAILCFDPKSVSFSVKDLKSSNGTYLNEQRLQSEQPRKLNNMDLLRFGYDSKVYQIRSGSANPDHSRTLGGNLFSSHPESPMDTQADSPDDLTPSHRVQQALRDRPPHTSSNSRVSSPSYALDRDSGHGSSSIPSSPAKEMSPVPNSLFSSRLSPVPRPSQYSVPPSNSPDCLKSSSSYRYSKDMPNLDPLCITQDVPVRRDSLEDANEGLKSERERGYTRNRTETEFLRLEPDINVPNEVFVTPSRGLNDDYELTEDESNTYREGGMIRSRSLSGDGGRSRTELSSLYGTPHWWPDEFDVTSKKKHNLSYYNSNAARRRWSSDCSKNTSENGSADIGMTPGKESGAESDSDSLRTKTFSPMAFTVDFGGADAKKGFGIADSISKFAPRHRKNLSLTKIEDITGRGREASEQNDDSTTTAHLKPGKKFNSGGDRSAPKVLSAYDRLPAPIKENEVTKDKVPYRKTLSDKDSMLSKPKPKASVLPTQNSRRDGVSLGSKRDVDNSVPGRVSKEKCPPASSDVDDGKSETGTYTIDDSTEEVTEARENIDNIFGAITSSTATKLYRTDETLCDNLDVNCTAELEWVREWAESASKLQQDPIKGPEEGEAAMINLRPKPKSNISTQYHPRIRAGALAREASVLSDSGYALGYASDSSNEGMDSRRPTKYNRAFAIRSRLLGYDSDGCTNTKNRQTVTPVRGVSPRPNTSIESRPPLPTSASHFSRNDGGRFSLRASNKSRSPVNQMAPPTRPATGASGFASRLSQASKPVNMSKPQVALRKPPTQDVAPVGRKSTAVPVGMGNRSNSTLTAKEVELANWKRRKNYDPMKAAAQAKKKDPQLTPEIHSESEGAREHSVQRQKAPNSPVTSKSPYFHRSSFNTTASSYEDMPSMVDEMESSHSNSPMHCGMSRSMHEDNVHCGIPHSPSSNMRSKNKLEALDNLVIATIHSLSIKVRTSSRKLLEKLQAQQSDDENGELVKEMVSQLRDMETLNATSSPTKSPSKDLSGTLKNLKKLEQVILVLDRVICDDDGDM